MGRYVASTSTRLLNCPRRHALLQIYRLILRRIMVLVGSLVARAQRCIVELDYVRYVYTRYSYAKSLDSLIQWRMSLLAGPGK